MYIHTSVFISFEICNIQLLNFTNRITGLSGFVLCYHLQMKFAKVMFLHLSVSYSVHRRGVWYLSMHCRSPGPHPGGKLRGLAWGVSRPTPGGSPGPHLRGSPGPHLGGLQAHTQGAGGGVVGGGRGEGGYPSMH